MQTRIIQLIDQYRNVIATAQVADEGGFYGGIIDLHDTPMNLRELSLFGEFEEIVNGQMFAFLDDIQEKIASLQLKAVFDTGQEAFVKDLQIFPSTKDVSFKLVEICNQSAALVGHFATPEAPEFQNMHTIRDSTGSK